MHYVNAFSSRPAAAAALANTVAADTRAGVSAAGRARIVLCGGSSPVDMFASLAATPLAWDRVTIMPSDERWVSVDQDASNERLFRERVLTGMAADAQLRGLYRGQQTPLEAAAEVDNELAAIGDPFDHVVLGMGGDGHTASIFPHAANIEAMLASSGRVVVPDLPAGETARISLSVPRLTQARAISVLFFGADKWTVFERAATGAPPGELPIAAILNNAPVPVRVFWAP
ncbi:6-phosphogluconolactonase [Salinisphaera sp. USBA-960]|nr:6-phosphogluconolactonase [Salifodinibacter halophilus]NNC26797.1 6-phosphogluconolactonase [Salifodinibacter halophilus]